MQNSFPKIIVISKYSRRSEKVVQGGEPQTVQERTARRANAVILFLILRL